jgi:lysine 2,3-aminomutase
MNWQSELSSAFRRADELSSFLGWPVPQLDSYPLLITRGFATLIRKQGPSGVLARQFLPHQEESTQHGLLDPIGDQAHAKTAQLIHRYRNRALLIPTTVCPVNCRYCFRKNELLSDGPFAQEREQTLNYLMQHPEIEEVIFTGGDPLILSDEKLGAWLEMLATIPHIRHIRFHSRVPVILPTRLTEDLSDLLESFAGRFTMIMIVHSNHVSEWSDAAIKAVRHFRPGGLRWMSQSVLLKGINDSPLTLAELFRFFAQLDVRAYYLHHPDQVRGGMHFWLDLEAGRRIWGALHDQLPGWMLPQYVIDIPGGHGKTPAFNPEGHSFSGSLLDRSGQLIQTIQPSFPVSDSTAHP